MLCSVPASKSSSKWLDRLRSTKGIPTGDNLNLDHFLGDLNLHNSCDPSTQAAPDQCPQQFNPESTQPDDRRVLNGLNSESSLPSENGDRELYGLMTNILSELFYVGGSSRSSKPLGKKFPRKQANPKSHFIPRSTTVVNTDEKSPSCAQKDQHIPSSNSDNTVRGDHGEVGEELKKGGNAGSADVEEEAEDEEKSEKDLAGYSRSEVTVIDTSCNVWKSDKLIFRKRNVWKVREKKGKLRSYGRKKRKQDNNNCNDNGSIGIASENKKAKNLGQEEFSLSSKDLKAYETESLKPSNEDEDSQDRMGKEIITVAPDKINHTKGNVSTKSPDTRTQDIERRYPFSRSARQSKKRGSSNLEARRLDKRNGTKLPKKCATDYQRR